MSREPINRKDGEIQLTTRAEINEKYGIVRLMPSNIANEQLSEEEVTMYEGVVKMQIQEFDSYEDEEE